MNFRFDPRQGLIVIPVRVWGPAGDTVVRLALDTGATRSLVSAAVLVAIGYDPAVAPERVRVTTGSGVEYVPCLTVDRVQALGQERTIFPVLCHTLPPSTSVDGLLGTDYLRGGRLTIDFRAGSLSFE